MKLDIPYLMLGTFLIIGIFLQYNILSNLKSLPSPLYGGDYYYHLGMMYHLLGGGNIFENSQLLGEIPWAPFLYQYLVVLFSIIFNLSLMNAVIWFSIPLQIVSMIIFYLLSYYIFKDKWAALISPLFIISFFPIFKYTPFTQCITLPLFFLFVFLALSRNNLLFYVLAGISYGLVGLSHTMIFLEATIFLVVSYLFLILFSNKSVVIERYNIKINFSRIKKNLFVRNKFFIILLLGLLISQLYWYKPIFEFHLNIPNRISDYDQTDYSKVDLLNYSLNTFVRMFFIFSSVHTTIISIFILFGIIYLLTKQNIFENKFLLCILVALFISRFHYLLTFPIIGKDFFSEVMGHIFFVLKPFLYISGYLFIINLIKKEYTFRDKKVLCSFILITLMLNIFGFFHHIENDRWIKVGKEPLPDYLLEVQSWVLNNTNINDVFISTNEISFALNGLTGRKVLNSRRAHSGMYVDVDNRYADSAVILYGNNSDLTSRLLKKYNISYLYWQNNWLSLDYIFDEQGNLIHLFDPLLIRNVNNYSNYLSENGVKFKNIDFWLDSAKRNENVKKFDCLLVFPYNWSNENPFSPTFKEHLKLIKEFKEKNRVVARIYKVII